MAIQNLTWISSLAALPSLNNGSLNWSPRLAERASELQKKLQQSDPEIFASAVQAEANNRLAAFADGIKAYRAMPGPSRPPEPPVIWTEGTSRILDYGAFSSRPDGPIVLFVPALVNRGYVLDISEKRSLLRDLAGRGFRPLLVDWGAPGDEEKTFDLDAYIGQRLTAALKAVNELARGPVPVVGYCMGGLLSMALAGANPDRVSSLVLMATPWNFHSLDPGKTRMLKAMAPVIEQMLETVGYLPVDMLQTMFTGLDPNLASKKFRAFSSLNKKSARALEFTALEDWLNDGVALAGPTARECLIGWYVENRPDRGDWIIGGAPVRPEDIHMPSLVIVPENDYIVPPESSAPVADLLPDASVLRLQAGHIGMVVGSKAKKQLFEPLAKWLEKACR
ncbi:MAG: alpha/beta fold hydrolase [Rhodospirillaceae bacterium]|nr:alpha/beta fold hydrolase [Rhodospirillaceae bacterium]